MDFLQVCHGIVIKPCAKVADNSGVTKTLRNLPTLTIMALALVLSLTGSVHLAGASPADTTATTQANPCQPVCGGGVAISAMRVSHDAGLNFGPGDY